MVILSPAQLWFQDYRNHCSTSLFQACSVSIWENKSSALHQPKTTESTALPHTTVRMCSGQPIMCLPVLQRKFAKLTKIPPPPPPLHRPSQRNNGQICFCAENNNLNRMYDYVLNCFVLHVATLFMSPNVCFVTPRKSMAWFVFCFVYYLQKTWRYLSCSRTEPRSLVFFALCNMIGHTRLAAYTVKKLIVYPVPTRDVTNQSLPGRE